VSLTEDFRLPQDAVLVGYEYFLEVSVARDEVLSSPIPLSSEQRLAAVVYYAENDAFREWLNELGRLQ
jgi:hypothetical protein